MSVHRVGPYRMLVETECYDCFVQVWHSEKNDDWKGVEIGVLSGHLPFEHMAWRGFNGRLRRAWRALRGREEPHLEFFSRANLVAFIEAVDTAKKEAFG